jgi:glycosyltransferase involved in cell wall biosynthesis
LLVVSHFFPPMGGGGVQRITKFVKYLERCGWRSTVLAGRPEDYWMHDATLLADLPPSTRVVRTVAASGLGLLRRLRPGGVGSERRSTRLFGGLRRAAAWLLVPDSYVGWRPFALRAARAVLAEDPPDAILSTSPPETNHVVALQLAREAGIPWLADFRDPWFALHLHPAPTSWHRARHARLEAAVLREAGAVLATTLWLRELLRERAPTGRERLVVVRNGFDTDDFPDATEIPIDTQGPLRLVHTGMLTLTRSAAGLLRALHLLAARRPELRDAFLVDLVGARESRNDALVAELGLADRVRLRGYVPHADAVAAQRQADVLVLIKHEEERFRGLVPGKMYEYMGAGRPILALAPDCETADLVRDLGWGEVAPPDDPPAIAAALERLLQHKRAGTLAGAYPRRGREQFERRAQAETVAALLGQIAPVRRPPPEVAT